jgi:hypothetical protein
MHRSDVLIIGAGPTGLVLALWLSKLGVRVRIIDKTSAPGTTSRALAVQARTLELYRQLDLADTVVRNGHKVAAAHFWVKGKPVAQLPLQRIGEGLTPYSFIEIFPRTSTNGCCSNASKTMTWWLSATPNSKVLKNSATASPRICACPTGSRKSVRHAFSRAAMARGRWCANPRHRFPGRHLSADFLRRGCAGQRPGITAICTWIWTKRIFSPSSRWPAKAVRD